MEPKKVLVTWHDARFYPGTHKIEAIMGQRMQVFESLGWLISKLSTTTVIAAEHNDEDEYRDITLIPSGSIISIKDLIVIEEEA